MDYPDNSTETEKWRIVTTFEKTFTSASTAFFNHTSGNPNH
jgi:hypothetical protein